MNYYCQCCNEPLTNFELILGLDICNNCLAYQTA